LPPSRWATHADEKKAGRETSGQPAAEAPKPDAAAIFKKLDANNDGKVSKEEFLKDKKDAAKAEERFKKLDKDGDGFLTPEEFSAGHGKKAKQ